MLVVVRTSIFFGVGVFHTPHNSSSQQPADRELTSKQLAWLRKHHTHQTKKSVLPKKEKRLVWQQIVDRYSSCLYRRLFQLFTHSIYCIIQQNRIIMLTRNLYMLLLWVAAVESFSPQSYYSTQSVSTCSAPFSAVSRLWTYLVWCSLNGAAFTQNPSMIWWRWLDSLWRRLYVVQAISFPVDFVLLCTRNFSILRTYLFNRSCVNHLSHHVILPVHFISTI